jgi:tRNA (guanine-N7-)-methyltransferase
VRIRQHVNPLKSDFFRIPVTPLETPAGVPVEVELGSAEAFFLMERAQEEPAAHYVGVEIRRELVASSNGECRRLGLGNVRSVFANMSVDLPRLFAPGSVRRFHLNFPDPWFKSRQHKRRVVSPSLVADLHALLAPGGELYVATDIFEIALDAMAALEAEPPRRFANLVEPWTFLRESPFAARSRRERQCAAEGTMVWRLGYQRIHQ